MDKNKRVERYNGLFKRSYILKIRFFMSWNLAIPELIVNKAWGLQHATPSSVSKKLRQC